MVARGVRPACGSGESTPRIGRPISKILPYISLASLRIDAATADACSPPLPQDCAGLLDRGAEDRQEGHEEEGGVQVELY